MLAGESDYGSADPVEFDVSSGESCGNGEARSLATFLAFREGFGLTLQKPSINMPTKTDPCFVGVFHTLNQRRAQLYY